MNEPVAEKKLRQARRQIELLEKIGEGGQAVVYKAYDHLTNEEIAIKTIWSRHRTDRAAINRLKQGATDFPHGITDVPL